VLVTNSLDTNFTGGGQIDPSDNKLIVRNATAGSFTGSAYTGIAGAIQSGRNGGTWNGNGIVSSQAATNGGLTSLGIAAASDVKNISGTETATWSGETVSAGDALVMYTYAGDATLDGKINVDDYGRIDFNASLPDASGWFNGDFNYDGKINVDDYGIIDFNVGIQGAPFSTAGGTGLSAVSAVPEPASFLSIATFLILPGALGRRRRRIIR
jgi:hypothetical protein